MSVAAFAGNKSAAPASKNKAATNPTHGKRAAGARHDFFEPETDYNAAEREFTRKRDWSLSGVHMEAERDRSETVNARGNPGNSPGRVYGALQAPGKPMDASDRTFFESRVGHDLSHVRVHTDAQAADAARELHAAAFTIGSDIGFGADRYLPASRRGRWLLLHELRHAEQQRYAAPVAEPQLDPPTSAHESAARALLNSEIAPLSTQRVQCAPDDDSIWGTVGEAVLDVAVGPGPAQAIKSVGGSELGDAVGRGVFGETPWRFIKAVFHGIEDGLAGDIQSGRAQKAVEHVSGIFVNPMDAARFSLGFLVGLALGLISPITDLVKAIISIVKFSIDALDWLQKWSPSGIAASPERQQKIIRLINKFAALRDQFHKALQEFAADPKGNLEKIKSFLNDLMEMALEKAHQIGVDAAHSIFSFLEEPPYDLGKSLGEAIGALIANILILVFTDAIGNLVEEGVSAIAKAAEQVAGKAVEFINAVKSIAGKIVSLLRKALKGALKAFEGLVDSAVAAFEELQAVFSDIEVAGETAAAGVGKVGPLGPLKPMESRMVSGTRTVATRVEDLRPPKVHPSNLAPDKALTGPGSTAEAVEDLERTTAGRTHPPGEAAAIGTEIESMEVQQWSAELNAKGYRTYARNEFGQGRLGNQRLSQFFSDRRARPDMLAINDAERTIIVGDITASPGTTAKVPGLIGQEERLHIEKTIEYGRQLKRQLPPQFASYKVFAQDRFWHTGGATKLIEVK